MANEIKERFRERKYSYIRKLKLKKEKDIANDNILKVLLFSPLLILGTIGKKIEFFNEKSNDELVKITNEENNSKSNSDTNNKKVNNTQQKENISVNNYKFNKDINKEKLEQKIFLKLQKEIVRLKNEYEIIESEEYLLTKYENDNNLYLKAKAINEKINSLLERLEEINDKFTIFKNKNIIDDPYLLDNSLLIDDILNYKEKIKEEDINIITNKIKLLNEYEYMYINLDKLITKIELVKMQSEEREKKLLDRDNKYDKAKSKIINLTDIDEGCNQIIEKNTKYLEELNKKVNNINERKYIESKLIGMNGFLSSTLKYLGLLSLTPLRGILPGIGAKTIATRRLLQNMLKNMHYEKQEKIIYSAKDFESEINNKIYNIDSVGQNIKLALAEVRKLKSEFKEEYLSYNLTEYDKAYKKIETIEKSIINSQEKLDIMKEKLYKNKELNKNTLKKVRELNSKN